MGAAVLEHVGDEFEAVIFSVVGVWNAGNLVLRFCAVAGELLDLITEFLLGIKGYDILIVLCIHGEDEVEFKEVCFGKLSSSSCCEDISVFESLAHPMIGRFAGVVVVGSCGVDVVVVG